MQIIKYLFIAVAIIIFGYISLVIIGSLEENASLEQPRTFHIMFDHYFYKNETLKISNSYPDIQIDLLLSYPRGILVVDDPVEISGIAIAYTPVTRNITDIAINFLGAQIYPEAQDNRGITQGVSINLLRIPGTNKFVGNATMVWRLEGTYFPRLYVTGYREDTTHYYPNNDIAITVYPKSELAQIVTNKAILWLAIVGTIIAFLGFFNIFRKAQTIKPENEKNNNQTITDNITNQKDNFAEERKNSKEPNKTSRQDCPERKDKH